MQASDCGRGIRRPSASARESPKLNATRLASLRRRLSAGARCGRSRSPRCLLNWRRWKRHHASGHYLLDAGVFEFCITPIKGHAGRKALPPSLSGGIGSAKAPAVRFLEVQTKLVRTQPFEYDYISSLGSRIFIEKFGKCAGTDKSSEAIRIPVFR